MDIIDSKNTWVKLDKQIGIEDIIFIDILMENVAL